MNKVSVPKTWENRINTAETPAVLNAYKAQLLKIKAERLLLAGKTRSILLDYTQDSDERTREFATQKQLDTATKLAEVNAALDLVAERLRTLTP